MKKWQGRRVGADDDDEGSLIHRHNYCSSLLLSLRDSHTQFPVACMHPCRMLLNTMQYNTI